jgi:hypothetical protein
MGSNSNTEIKLTRNCPRCGVQLHYSHRTTLWLAAKENWKCRKCTWELKPVPQADEILDLFNQNLTLRQIGSRLGLHHNTIGYRVMRLGLPSNRFGKRKLEIVSEKQARCSKCGLIKDFDEFSVNRRGRRYEYKLSYCFSCRREQMEESLNGNSDRFLSDRHNRLCLRSRKMMIECVITKKEFIDQYEAQRGLCFYTDKPLRLVVGSGKNPDSLSVDRIDPRIGYTLNNVVLCCTRINTIKSNMLPDELREWIPDWYTRIVCFRRSKGLDF